MISKSLTFWTLLAGLLAFIARFYFPTFPLDAATILAAILSGLYPAADATRERALLALGWKLRLEINK